MSTRLYVGNLGSDTASEQLQAMFARFGKVDSVHIALDATTSKPRGFGFVEMADAVQANAAIKGLNGLERDGRLLVVNRPGPRGGGDSTSKSNGTKGDSR